MQKPNVAQARKNAVKPGRGGAYHSPRALVLLVVACGGCATLAAAAIHAATPVPPPLPLALQQAAPGGPVGLGGVVNRPTVTLLFRGGAGTSAAIPEAEVASAGQQFTGTVSLRGRIIPAGARHKLVRLTLTGLRDGAAYHWRVRLLGRDGRVSRWVDFGDGLRGGAVSFRVDLTPPAAPVLSSPTDPDSTAWYNTPQVTLTWPAPRDASGIAGYAYTLDHSATGTPAPRLTTRQAGLSLPIPADGHWYVHVRALDGAGNWGATATYALAIDTRPGTLSSVTFRQTSFNPAAEHEAVDVTLANPARLQVQIFQESTGALVRTLDYKRVDGPLTVLWDGRDSAGHIVPEGYYRFLFTSTDAMGQQSSASYWAIGVTLRRVVVSLSQQRMVVYDGTKAVLTTLVTTGNKLLPTPLGTFHIIEKLHPFTFISPWPKGSPFYYAPSPVQYALLFDWGGYYIHDAPWRSQFGPGSNAQSGRPGQNTTGTHGCVNVPASVAAWLYQWAPVGTTVQIVP